MITTTADTATAEARITSDSGASSLRPPTRFRLGWLARNHEALEWGLACVAVVLTHMASSASVEVVRARVHGAVANDLIRLWLLSCGLAFGFVCLLVLVRQGLLTALRVRARDFVPAFVAFFAGLAAFGFAHSTAEFAGAWIGEGFGTAVREVTWIGPLFLGLFIALAIALFRLDNREVLAPRTRLLTTHDPADQRSCLVIFLSPTSITDLDAVTSLPSGLSVPSVRSLRDDIDALERYRKDGGKSWTWQMPLRGIHHHVNRTGQDQGRLRHIIVVASTQTISQLPMFGRLLANYVRELADVRTRAWIVEPVLNRKGKSSPSGHLRFAPLESSFDGLIGFDFENVDRLSDAIRELVERLRDEGISDNDIMIDFTSGMKPNSVVAAAVTFGRRVQAQYVQTGGDHHVLSYDWLAPREVEIS